MRKISADWKGKVKVKVENLDDLWYLSQVIDREDLVSGRTFRKLKIGEEKTEKKPVFLKIQAEKIEFSDNQSQLRVLGTIVEGPEDISHGEHHSFTIEEGTELSIEKQKWLGYQKDKMEEAFSSKTSPILIVVFDREEAYFALMKKYGYDILTHLEGHVAKKGMDTGKTSNFYEEIIKAAKDYDERHHFQNIIMASPSFWKDELMKNLHDEELKKKIVAATCSTISKTAIDEVLKREEVKKVLSQDRIAKEVNLVESLMKEISTDGKSSYGMKETKQAIEQGAAETLLITDTLIQKLRSEEKFDQLDKLMRQADSMKASVHIISSKHEGGKKLDGLGGIGAILRYKAYG